MSSEKWWYLLFLIEYDPNITSKSEKVVTSEYKVGKDSKLKVTDYSGLISRAEKKEMKVFRTRVNLVGKLRVGRHLSYNTMKTAEI